ncbi:MAG: tRNA-dihydrouridine synthase [Coriobacteriales bacterium]|nr:tRNA-dihydrouridine synthase [Coriobacteriales bacterium]
MTPKVGSRRPPDPHAVVGELLENNRWLAPMAGIGDPVFRGLCLEQGAGLTCTEMISAKGLHYGNEATADLLCLAPGEERCAVQLFGADPELMAMQAARIEDAWGEHLALIDINMGCPVPKVTRKGEGSALMRRPELAARIVEEVSDAVSVPVTIKCRSGWDDGEDSAPVFVQRMERAGAHAACVHGRSARQGYSGASDREVIARCVQAVDIPILASGDLFTYETLGEVLERTGAAGVAVARGACGNPWIFNGYQPTSRDRVEMALRHAMGLCADDEHVGIRRMRKHMAHYLVGFPAAARTRELAVRCGTLGEFQELCQRILALLDQREQDKEVGHYAHEG